MTEQNESDKMNQDEINPYLGPASGLSPVNTAGSGVTLSENSLYYLKAVSPWLRFIAIVSLIGCGLMSVTGVVMMLVLGLSVNIAGDIAESLDFSGSFLKKSGAIMGGFFGLFEIGFAVVCFFPAKYLWVFGTKIRTYFQNHSEVELETAFKNNKAFWKFYGILTIAGIALFPLLIIITTIFAVVSAIG